MDVIERKRRKWWVQVQPNGLPTRIASGDEEAVVPVGGQWIEVVPADQLQGAVSLLREVRVAGAPEGWPVGKRVRWMTEVDRLLSDAGGGS